VCFPAGVKLQLNFSDQLFIVLCGRGLIELPRPVVAASNLELKMATELARLGLNVGN
jgi:hypothetical protein